MTGYYVGFVLRFTLTQVMCESFDEWLRQHHTTIFLAFAVAHGDLLIFKIHVLDAQAHRFHQAQPRAVEQACHQAMCPGDERQHALDFIRGEHDRHPLRAFGAFDALNEWQLDVQHFLVEKQ